MLGVWRLQILREVARRGTIKHAAAMLSITPSAASQQLKVLETEAGARLLEPNGRQVRLTEAGRALVEHADAIIAALEAAESDLATLRNEVVGTLRVAAFPTAARALLPDVIASLGRRHPRLRITLRDFETPESLAALRVDDIDVAVIDEYSAATPLNEPGIDFQPLLRDPIRIALPAGRSTSADPVRLDDLRGDAWIMDTETSSIFQAVRQACRERGFEPNIRSNCKDYSVIIALVEAGLGVAALPGLALRDRPIRARVVRIKPSLERIVLSAVKTERRRHPAVAAMLSELQSSTM